MDIKEFVTMGNKPSCNMRELALKLASHAHRGQKQKNGEEYIKHPITVASFLDSDILKIIAYLHDTCEDTDLTLNDLHLIGFSDQIIDAVNAITKRDGEKYADYIERVKTNELALKVKVADATHNSDLSRIPNPTPHDIEKNKKYINLTKELTALLSY